MTIINDYIEDIETVEKSLFTLENSITGVKAFRKIWQRMYDELSECKDLQYENLDQVDLKFWVERYMRTLENLGQLGFIKLREE